MSFFGKILRDVGKVTQGAGQVVSHVAKATGNALKPSELVSDAGFLGKNLPGALLNIGVAPLHAATLTVGGGAELVGGIIHNEAMVQVGKSIVHTDAQAAAVIQQNPVHAGEVVAGGALIAVGSITGVAMAPGIALAAAGTKGLLQDMAKKVAMDSAQQNRTTSTIPKPVEVTPPKVSESQTAPAGVPRASLLKRVEAWVSFRFGNGKGLA